MIVALSNLLSIIDSIIVGGIFVYVFIFVYDLFYGEKPEKQMKKIRQYFRKEAIKKIDMLKREPKKYTTYQITLEKEKIRIKMKPGYKVVKLVAKKK